MHEAKLSSSSSRRVTRVLAGVEREEAPAPVIGHTRGQRYRNPYAKRDKAREPGIELGLSDHFPGLDPVELDSGCG